MALCMIRDRLSVMPADAVITPQRTLVSGHRQDAIQRAALLERTGVVQISSFK